MLCVYNILCVVGFFETCIAEEQFEAEKLDIMRDALRAKTNYSLTTKQLENMPIAESPEPPPLSPSEPHPPTTPPVTSVSIETVTVPVVSVGSEVVSNGNAENKSMEGSEVINNGNAENKSTEGSEVVSNGNAENKSTEGSEVIANGDNTSASYEGSGPEVAVKSETTEGSKVITNEGVEGLEGVTNGNKDCQLENEPSNGVTPNGIPSES